MKEFQGAGDNLLVLVEGVICFPQSINGLRVEKKMRYKRFQQYG